MGSWFVPVCTVLSVVAATTACSILLFYRYRQIKENEHARITHQPDDSGYNHNGITFDSSDLTHHSSLQPENFNVQSIFGSCQEPTTLIDPSIGLNCKLVEGKEQVEHKTTKSKINERPRRSIPASSVYSSHSAQGCQLMEHHIGQLKFGSESTIPTVDQDEAVVLLPIHQPLSISPCVITLH
jgi:hypothetical protein